MNQPQRWCNSWLFALCVVDHGFDPRSVKPKTMKIFLAASPLSTLVLSSSSCSKNWFGIRIMCLSGMTFLTKKISQFLFLGVEDIRQVKKKSMCIFPEKIYSQCFTTVQTLFLSIIPRFYYISILKLIYVYYSASQRFNDLAPSTVFDIFSPLFTLSKIECSPSVILKSARDSPEQPRYWNIV